jgi:polar amino acid transport system substrate-binding protein
VARELLADWQQTWETTMLRFALAIALTLLPTLGFAQGPQLVDSGKLTWGAAATFPPFEYMQNDKPVGFDVDLVAALAKQMNLESDIAQIAFAGLIPAIEGKRIDLIVSGMYINPQRTQVIDMVPYVYVGNQVVVREGNPKHITGKDGLCGFNVAAPVGTVFETTAKQVSTDCKTAGKPEISLLSLTGTVNCALALTQGRADAIIVSTPVVGALITETPGAYATAGAPWDTTTQMGIGVRKDNPALKDAVDKALKAIVADGTYAALIKKWNLPPASSAF